MAQEGGVQGMSAKAGLEHRSYPYDLKRVKLIMLGMIPSLIPSVPIGDNRTKSISILFAYTNFDFIYIINTYIASSRI
ncbi:hypothetical protein CIFRMM251M_02515 [Citrobacter freundii]